MNNKIPIILGVDSTEVGYVSELNNEFEYITSSIDSPYIYYIPIFNVHYFNDNTRIGFKNIHEDIKNDIREGRCFIVMYPGDEGYFGAFKNDSLDIVHAWIKESNFPKNSVHFICMNLIIDKVAIKNNLSIVGYPTVHNSETFLISPHTNQLPVELESEFKLFLNYNKTIRDYRIYLLIKILEKKLLENAIISFGEHIDKDIMNNKYDNFSEFNVNKSDVDKISDITPIYINNLNISPISAYEISNILGQEVCVDDYKNTFLSLVSETLVCKDTIYLSEKIFKPILMGHPFMLIASPNSLSKLKELGYKTFDKWWDESYDECEEYNDRIDLILNEIEKLKNKSNEELFEIRKEMYGVLKYNQDHYFKRIKEKNPINDIVKGIYKKLLDENK